jgi:hypothetical protein
MDKGARVQLWRHARNATTSRGFQGGTATGVAVGVGWDLLTGGPVTLSALGLLGLGAILGLFGEHLYHRVWTAPMTTIDDLRRQLSIYMEAPKFVIEIMRPPMFGVHDGKVVVILPVRVTCEVQKGNPLRFAAWIENENGVNLNLKPFSGWTTLTTHDGSVVSSDELVSETTYLQEGESLEGYWVGWREAQAWNEAASLRARIQCLNYKKHPFISIRAPIRDHRNVQPITVANA